MLRRHPGGTRDGLRGRPRARFGTVRLMRAGPPAQGRRGSAVRERGTVMKHRTMLVASTMVLLGALFSQTALAGSGAASSPLTGDGSGQIAVALTREDQGTLAAQITANVQASPNTTYSVQRALDPTPDGTCDSLGPFEEQGTLDTNDAGAGAAHIEVH